MQSYTVRLRDRGQVTIPQAVRNELAVKEGDTLTMVQIDGIVLLRPKQPVVPQLSEQFSQQMDEAGLSLADLLEGLAQERQISSESRFRRDA